MLELLITLLAIHMLYWLFLFTRLIFHEDVLVDQDKAEDVTSITCVKNESNKIVPFLASLKNQDIQERIIVDDFSNDGTSERIRELDPSLVILRPIKDIPGKKEAIIRGIQAAKQELLLFTDVDCFPQYKWAELMKKYALGKALVLGYSPMVRKNGLVALFSKYETYHTALQYLSYAISGMAYMGVGRNMLIRRSAALSVIPILRNDDLASGDDDLMVNAIARHDNVKIALNPATFVNTTPEETLSGFIHQKRRHITTSTRYRPIHQILLGLYSLTFMLFYIGLIISGCFGFIDVKTLLFLLLTKWFFQQLINYPIMKRLQEFELWKYFPVLDILMFLYLMVLTPYIVFQNKSRWK